MIGLILLASLTQPATINYTTSGVDPITYIQQANPPCAEWNKRYTDQYGKLATAYCKDNKRWRPWVCITTGQEGIDVEPLPECFGK